MSRCLWSQDSAARGICKAAFGAGPNPAFGKANPNIGKWLPPQKTHRGPPGACVQSLFFLVPPIGKARDSSTPFVMLTSTCLGIVVVGPLRDEGLHQDECFRVRLDPELALPFQTELACQYRLVKVNRWEKVCHFPAWLHRCKSLFCLGTAQVQPPPQSHTLLLRVSKATPDPRSLVATTPRPDARSRVGHTAS